MGKVKTVVMGDLEAEEAARKKAEAKREQKKLEKDKTKAKKEAQKEEEIVTEAISEELEGETTEKKEETEVEKEEEKTEKKKPTKKTAEKYVFLSGKKYLAAKTLVNNKKLYPIKEAIDLVKKTSISKFDGTVEVHINVTEKNLRGNVTLPHSTGKQVRVVVATDDLINSINSNNSINFDVLVAAPEMMPELAKIARILGPKGLMPNPKTNTISDKPEELVKTLSSSLSWKTQPDFPIIHSVIGKVSFDTKKLEENLAALTKSIGRDKIVSAFLKATMGPSIKIGL